MFPPFSVPQFLYLESRDITYIVGCFKDKIELALVKCLEERLAYI